MSERNKKVCSMSEDENEKYMNVMAKCMVEAGLKAQKKEILEFAKRMQEDEEKVELDMMKSFITCSEKVLDIKR